MIELPKEYVVNKIITKKTFYEKIGITSNIKDDFINYIEKIIWKYKLAEENINISKTDKVEEIEIFEIELKSKKIPKNVLKVISKAIPYKILFILKYLQEFTYVIVEDDIYNTEWNKEIEFDFTGYSLSDVYEKLIKTIIEKEGSNEAIEKILEKEKNIKELNNKIEQLTNKMNKEVQFKKKVELNQEIRNLKNKLEEIKDE